jgi:tRNA (cytidine/uridine-2'-O-)-methyltransferase
MPEITGKLASPLDDRFHVILVEPEIAGNVGAVGRTCVAVGAMLWLIRPLGFLMTDRHIRRAGLDYWPDLDWRVIDHLDEVAEALGPDRLWLFSTKGTTAYTDASLAPGDGLVFGPESRGLPASWLDASPSRTLRIPIRPEARSLNLSNSAAIALFEAQRQREQASGRPGWMNPLE